MLGTGKKASNRSGSQEAPQQQQAHMGGHERRNDAESPTESQRRTELVSIARLQRSIMKKEPTLSVGVGSGHLVWS